MYVYYMSFRITLHELNPDEGIILTRKWKHSVVTQIMHSVQINQIHTYIHIALNQATPEQT
jgi:hypothetical protein